MSGARRAGGGAGTERVIAKLKKSVENENYYEAHQMYRTLYFRYIGQKKYEDLERMLYDGAILLFSHKQVESGLDLAKLYIDTLKEGEFKPEDSKFIKICRLYEEIPVENVDKAAFLGTCLKWSNYNPNTAIGHPRLHQHIAYSLWKQRKYPESRQHFLHSCDGEGCGSMLVEFHTAKGFNSEVDLFIAQTVLQYLCLKKHLVAAVAFLAYTTGHPKIQRGPPYTNPLLNFVWFLLLAIETSSSLSAFTVLCEKYKKFIDRDPQYIEYLDRIGQLFFGVPAPERPQGMFSGLFNSLLSAMNDDSSDDEMPPTSAITSPGPSQTSQHSRKGPARNLETADLD
eukprot:TRINITY_DN6135_c0_g1_i1.p1 TRINITY_DN6135_c0_g1~~TRINITY_DN6135_c0_g1_i1.p1  ORF type:complete len:348 (-),score=55.01 TRINITY_DN6135_c0_g1_i1:297-1319(-)